MTPQTALWIILAASLFSSAAAAPLAWEFAAEIKRAKKNLNNYAATGALTALLGFVILGLWWYYALATDQTLLAVIPTVALVWGWMVRGIVSASRKGDRA